MSVKFGGHNNCRHGNIRCSEEYSVFYKHFRSARVILIKYSNGTFCAIYVSVRWVWDLTANWILKVSAWYLFSTIEIIFLPLSSMSCVLTHWGRVTHICVSKLIIIGSDNGLSPGRRQAIIWTNAEILSIGPLSFHSRKCIWKCRQEIGSHLVPASMC